MRSAIAVCTATCHFLAPSEIPRSLTTSDRSILIVGGLPVLQGDFFVLFSRNGQIGANGQNELNSRDSYKGRLWPYWL